MSFKKFPSTQFVKVLDADESFKMAKYATSARGEIGSIRVKIYKRGNCSGSIVLILAKSQDNSSILATSTGVSISEIAPNSIGWVRFDFAKQNIALESLDVFAVVSAYTRDSSNYLSLVYDFPLHVYNNSEISPDDNPISTEVYTYS
jgi:hypothetical protein